MSDHNFSADHALASWLAGQFRSLSSVRRSRVNANQRLSEPPPLLVVDTWMQATLFVYTCPEIPAVREIRRILSHNTRSGVGTAFLLHRSHIPNMSSFRAPDWLIALNALTHERLFTYEERARAFAIDRLQLQPLGPPGEYRLIWRDDVRFQRLAVSERVIHHGPLRGRWLSADLDSKNLKEDYAAAAHARRLPSPALDPLTRESYDLLGLSSNATGTEIRQAFRRLARETHPDLSNLPSAEAEIRFRRLQNAYEHLLQRRNAR